MGFRDIAASAQVIDVWCIPLAGKRPLVYWKPYQQCPPDDALLDYWSQRWPWAGGGIPTGSHTNLLVVDTDSREAAAWYLSRGSARTWCARTRKGFHFYYSWPGADIRNSAGKVGPGVDVRAEGGFVVAPGSTVWFLQGRRWERFTYRWCKGYSPADLPRAQPPSWLCEQLERKPMEIAPAPVRAFSGTVSPYARRAFDANINRLIDARNGSRNHTLIEVACRMGNLIATGELLEGDVVKSVMAVVGNWTDESLAKSQDCLRRGIEYGKGHA